MFHIKIYLNSWYLLGANKTGHIFLQNMETVHLLFLIQSKLIHYMQSLTVQGTSSQWLNQGAVVIDVGINPIEDPTNSNSNNEYDSL